MGPPTVVLVHGIRASRTMWRRQLATLAAAGVPAVAPDLPGHGRRAAEPFTLAGATATIEEAAESAAGGEIVAVGLSLGSYLTLHWAARSRQRVVGVLAAGSSTRPRGIGLAAYRRLAALIARLPDGGRRLNDTMARIALPRQALTDLGDGGMSLGAMGAALAAMTQVDPLGDLRALGEVPVRLVNGRWDHFRTEERRFLRACANGRLEVVPGAHHLVSLVRPAEFDRIMLDLVAEACPDAGITAGGCSGSG